MHLRNATPPCPTSLRPIPQPRYARSSSSEIPNLRFSSRTTSTRRHWGFPSEFLKYGSESDRIGGEYKLTSAGSKRRKFSAADAALPASERRTFLLAPAVNKDTPLLPAGLLGPVTLQPRATGSFGKPVACW